MQQRFLHLRRRCAYAFEAFQCLNTLARAERLHFNAVAAFQHHLQFETRNSPAAESARGVTDAGRASTVPPLHLARCFTNTWHAALPTQGALLQ